MSCAPPAAHIPAPLAAFGKCSWIRNVRPWALGRFAWIRNVRPRGNSGPTINTLSIVHDAWRGGCGVETAMVVPLPQYWCGLHTVLEFARIAGELGRRCRMVNKLRAMRALMKVSQLLVNKIRADATLAALRNRRSLRANRCHRPTGISVRGGEPPPAQVAYDTLLAV